MEYRVLGQSDLRVSTLGIGGATFGRESDADTSFAVLDHALGCGINLVDTAEAYGNGRSEEIVGQWLAARRTRAQIVLATKVRPPLTHERVLASADASLKRLQTDRIDLFQLHAWDANTPIQETLEALNLLVQQGKVRYIGCSNFCAWQLWQSNDYGRARAVARFESVQSNYNLVVRTIEAELLPLCAEQKVGVITYSPLGGGFLTGKYRPGGPIPSGTRMDHVPLMQPIYFHPAGFRIAESLIRVAAERGITVPLLAMAWVMTQPAITTVLVGARSTAQIDQALQAAAQGMSPELRTEIGAL